MDIWYELKQDKTSQMYMPKYRWNFKYPDGR